MSEGNKTLLRLYVDAVWHKRNLGALRELMSPALLDPADKEYVRGPAWVRRFREAYREAFPDADVTVEDQLPLP
jgi:SnoaL-like polyketide cyclase